MHKLLFSDDYWNLRNLDHNFAKIVATPGNEYENYVVPVKGQLLVKIS